MNEPSERLHALDAVRGFALLLGVAFHAALSFMPNWPPGLWAATDNSPSAALSDAAFVTHIFRMSLFFFIAGFFARVMHNKLGTGGFWSNRAKRIVVPLVIGWMILFPAIAFVWTWGFAKSTGGAALPIPQMSPGAFPLTHLWFLYQLLVLYVGFLGARALLRRAGVSEKLGAIVDALLSKGVRNQVAVLALGGPLAATLVWIPTWFYWTGIPTPEHSLIPQIPATVGYGTAFAVGWFFHRSRDLLAVLAQRWQLNLGLAVAVTGAMLYLMHQQPQAQPGLIKNAFAYLFGVSVWSWIFGLTGAALRFLSNHSPVRRYIADSSYWVYLAHLPIIAALQVWVAHWPLHWSLKYPFILGVGFAILFASYHLLVRPTFVGQLLNGRRVRRGARSIGETPSIAPSSGVAPLASLKGVIKRFGTTTALAGVDLDVKPGELLAVLGPNGAGKSTAIALWLGLIEADAGEVRMFGGAPQDIENRRRLGVMMQDVELVKELRVRELLALAASYYSDPMTLAEVLSFTGTTPLADRPYGKLSGGQKRQVQFAIAVVGRPRLVFLDEPTVGLDVQAREALWRSIRALLADGCSVVLTTHYLEEAERLATRVAVLTKGRVIATGSVAEMRALVARRQIRCESSTNPDIVRSWDGVTDVAQDGDRLVVTAQDAETIVRRLLAADPALKRLEVREAGLTEAFNELTREAA
jgi:ABC-type multidrug transport system ATPase subunit/surface polysaccharide O-acyltransferase-like enzyme